MAQVDTGNKRNEIPIGELYWCTTKDELESELVLVIVLGKWFKRLHPNCLKPCPVKQLTVSRIVETPIAIVYVEYRTIKFQTILISLCWLKNKFHKYFPFLSKLLLFTETDSHSRIVVKRNRIIKTRNTMKIKKK